MKRLRPGRSISYVELSAVDWRPQIIHCVLKGWLAEAEAAQWRRRDRELLYLKFRLLSLPTAEGRGRQACELHGGNPRRRRPLRLAAFFVSFHHLRAQACSLGEAAPPSRAKDGRGKRSVAGGRKNKGRALF